MLLIRNAEVEGSRDLDVFCHDGKIHDIGQNLVHPDAETVDANGGVLLPGLHDHHVHQFAHAARFLVALRKWAMMRRWRQSFEMPKIQRTAGFGASGITNPLPACSTGIRSMPWCRNDRFVSNIDQGRCGL